MPAEYTLSHHDYPGDGETHASMEVRVSFEDDDLSRVLYEIKWFLRSCGYDYIEALEAVTSLQIHSSEDADLPQEVSGN